MAAAARRRGRRLRPLPAAGGRSSITGIPLLHLLRWVQSPQAPTFTRATHIQTQLTPNWNSISRAPSHEGAPQPAGAALQGGEAARQIRNAPQPKFWGGPANRSGHVQVQAQEALAHESPMLVSNPPFSAA